MKVLHKMILKDFIPTMLVALVFFILILQLVDLFGNLWRYLNADVPLRDIAYVSLLYTPKCVSFSLPIAILFSISYTLGNYYANNELIAVFGSGYSLYQLTRPLLISGILLSLAGYFFEDRIVIPTFKDKNRISKEIMGQTVSYSNSNVAVLSHKNTVIYIADFYNDRRESLTGLSVLFLDSNGGFEKRIDSNSALWEDNQWSLKNVRVYKYDENHDYVEEEFFTSWTEPLLNEPPGSFKRISRDIDEMNSREAKEWVDSLKRTGFPYRGALTEYYQRFSFALTPLVVAFLSCSLGGRFKKNILLMSLLSSLVVSVIYFVAQMIMVLLAKLGYIPPLYGAWAAFLIFLVFGLYLFKTAKT
ncbi:YjgP/YjgQ family permease [Oceanispirochaeta crateris]|uniref:YjgP/YjgQ family permease n=1 Tax=Oceanispirochaeta crateris TaxID=2518645 RepID=A0A5C1QM57_9SPIO|nr:LptF/LptG family permease [Oceanispirochaeta crateris]QEN07644.1 YjgP/YjgQ family permease [Oceanispirochaeta crateris]